jgi:hypothetical protein
MRGAVFDAEANGLMNMVKKSQNATRMWCGVTHDFTGKIKKYYPYAVKLFLRDISSLDYIIGHNIIDYDLELLKRLYNFELSKDTVVIDTYLWSQMLWPDLDRHFLCSGKKSPHSLENWGCIFHRHKPEHEDWMNYSQDMLHRCAEDVEINYLLWEKINQEAGIIDFKLDGGLQDRGTVC